MRAMIAPVGIRQSTVLREAGEEIVEEMGFPIDGPMFKTKTKRFFFVIKPNENYLKAHMRTH